jgi:hypothetical protein
MIPPTRDNPSKGVLQDLRRDRKKRNRTPRGMETALTCDPGGFVSGRENSRRVTEQTATVPRVKDIYFSHPTGEHGNGNYQCPQ